MAVKRFSLDDQSAFADLSHDYNPIHVDPVIARRLIYGQPVVHGVNALLWALSLLAKQLARPTLISDLSCSFIKPIVLEIDTAADITLTAPGKAELRIRQYGNLIARFKLEYLDAGVLSQAGFSTPWPSGASILQRNPEDVSGESMATRAGSLELFLNCAEVDCIYGPDLLTVFGQGQIAEIIALTRLVGMHVPGLNSLFTEIKLKRSSWVELRVLQYRVTDFDSRFQQATIACRSPSFESTLKAFLRPRLIRQAGYADIQAKTARLDVGSHRALVIGGSRGIGEVTAKVLAAGGADVLITYSKGREDAEAVVEDVRSHGGKARAIQCDVLGSIDAALSDFAAFKPTHVYFFATPYIFNGQKDTFSYTKLQSFLGFYIQAFDKIVQALLAVGTINFFHPSTVAIEEMPAAMGEYTVAKAAVEAYCQWLSRNRPQLNIYVPRLPRIATDQTVSILSVDNNDSIIITEYISTFLAESKTNV